MKRRDVVRKCKKLATMASTCIKMTSNWRQDNITQVF